MCIIVAAIMHLLLYSSSDGGGIFSEESYVSAQNTIKKNISEEQEVRRK